jgi:DNA-binding response OmpR family regulator
VLKVLFVDNEPDIAETMKAGLEQYGFAVDSFDKSVDVPIHKAKQYDIAILDVRMPEIGGFQLARLLWRQNEKLQVCFLTAFEIRSSEALAMLPSLKSHCFLKKPIAPSQLAKHIETHYLIH